MLVRESAWSYMGLQRYRWHAFGATMTVIARILLWQTWYVMYRIKCGVTIRWCWFAVCLNLWTKHGMYCINCDVLRLGNAARVCFSSESLNHYKLQRYSKSILLHSLVSVMWGRRKRKLKAQQISQSNKRHKTFCHVEWNDDGSWSKMKGTHDIIAL